MNTLFNYPLECNIENRTCEKCKYFKEGKDVTHICTIGNSCGIDEYGVPSVLRTFCCNEFEKKTKKILT